jgi:transposase
VEGLLRNPDTPGGRDGREAKSAAFKAQAVKRLMEGGRGLSEVATELGLSTGQLSMWRTEILAAGSAKALAAAREAEEAEMLRLKRELKPLEEENLILRKAAAVFAKGVA